jgi:hypothetical protein
MRLAFKFVQFNDSGADRDEKPPWLVFGFM